MPHIAPADRVAVDTEADSLHVYREKLCLIQLSLPTRCSRADRSAGGVFTGALYTALGGKTIVLHGADYDLRLLRRAGGFVASAVFDTMIGARLIGRREFSYAALVQAEFGVVLVKGSQKANWARRPLTETMAIYAQNDTRYLLALAERLEVRLRELGRWAWFEQSCQRALDQAAVEREKDAEEAWRINGSGALRGRSAAILRELWRWRESEAGAVDRPTFHVMRNEDLLDGGPRLCRGRKTVFRTSARFPPHALLRSGRARADALPEKEWPVLTKRFHSRWTAEQEKRAEALKVERDRVAAELDLDSSIIAPAPRWKRSRQIPHGPTNCCCRGSAGCWD